jgi:hypothetical protein
MQRDPQSARQFYDLLIAAADHPSQHIRYVVAWCMGEDATHYRPFQQTLVRLAKDPDAKVRYNAALALVRFGDDAARPVLREMLVPHTVLGQWQSQPEQGIVVDILDKHDPVRPSTQLALIDAGQGEPLAVLAPLGGRIGDVMVRTGDRIGNGTPLCTIQPGFQQAYEALRGLAVVGESEALPYVEPYLDPEERFSHAQRARVQTPARLTADAIKARQQHATKPAPGRIPIHREIPSGKRARGGSDDE